jgi:hypothetical protein
VIERGMWGEGREKERGQRKREGGKREGEREQDINRVGEMREGRGKG